MKNIHSITLYENSLQEQLPDFDPTFPYIATCAELDKYSVPWHWHPAVELFFMKSGQLEYTTPGGTYLFPAGSGGFVNANVLHTSKISPTADSTIQCLHLFDPILLSGEQGSRIEEKYILPLTVSGVEILHFSKNIPAHSGILEKIQTIFQLDPNDWGYELQVRESLTQIWLQLLQIAPTATRRQPDSMIKQLMVYIHKHYQEPITIQQLAETACISKRTCFRLFQENLHTTPSNYIRSYRLQQARRLLCKTDIPITQIGYLCGLGSASYFGKCFNEEFGFTPAKFRKLARS